MKYYPSWLLISLLVMVLGGGIRSLPILTACGLLFFVETTLILMSLLTGAHVHAHTASRCTADKITRPRNI